MIDAATWKQLWDEAKKDCQETTGFKVGDRVRVAFPDPTSAKVHQDYLNAVGTVEKIRKDCPKFGIRLNGSKYPYREGPIHVRFDTPIVKDFGKKGKSTTSVGYLHTWELEKIS